MGKIISKRLARPGGPTLTEGYVIFSQRKASGSERKPEQRNEKRKKGPGRDKGGRHE